MKKKFSFFRILIKTTKSFCFCFLCFFYLVEIDFKCESSLQKQSWWLRCNTLPNFYVFIFLIFFALFSYSYHQKNQKYKRELHLSKIKIFFNRSSQVAMIEERETHTYLRSTYYIIPCKSINKKKIVVTWTLFLFYSEKKIIFSFQSLFSMDSK